MAALTSKKRNALKKTQFALPAQRAYPINDIAHARAALSRVAANGTPAQQKAVRTAVYRKYPQIKPSAKKK